MMCRLVAYIGNHEILISNLLEDPKNSLIHQSHAVKKGKSSINADGFGLAWYHHKVSEEPGIFKSTRPAWNDNNLKHISRKILSSCFLGHIRASTVGNVSLNNCHPFFYKQYAFIHNGTIRHFKRIKRALMKQLKDSLFFEIKGQTDSECLFFLIMHYLNEQSGEDLASAVKSAFRWLLDQQSQYGEDSFSRLNIVITDGKTLVATRFVSKAFKPLSLHYFLGDIGTVLKRGTYISLSESSASNRAVVVVSEPLEEPESVWQTFPVNAYLVVGPALQVSIEPFDF